MSIQNLKKGDKGEEVVKLQSLLNKTGAMLDPDGDFGPGTERGVKYAQDVAGVPVTGIADSAFQTWLDSLAKPFKQLDTNGVAFIAREETGGLAYYDAFTRWPQFPGGASGITIGVGYDLRMNTKEDFQAVWSNHLSADVIAELSTDIGKPGTNERVKELRQLGIEVPFKAAWQAFIQKTLPRFYHETLEAYSSLEDLPGLCQSVLVSLIFNRGASLKGSSRTEMKAIQNILSEASELYPDRFAMKNKLVEVADQIISMKRLWDAGSGLLKRRDNEAKLWRKGLDEW